MVVYKTICLTCLFKIVKCTVDPQDKTSSTLSVLAYKYEREGGRSFTVKTTKEWYSLTVNLRKLTSLKSFKYALLQEALDSQSLLYHF